MVETRKRKYVEEAPPSHNPSANPCLPSKNLRQSPRLTKKLKQNTATASPSSSQDDATSVADSETTVIAETAAKPKPSKRTHGKTTKTTTTRTPNPSPAPSPTQETTTPATALKRGRKWEMFLGREIRDRAAGVTDELLASFLESEVTARFPRGSTYAGATGQWSRTLEDGSTVVVKERTTVVCLVEFEGDDPGRVERFRALVAEAARAYKERFQQDAVLVCEVECWMDFL